LSIPIHPSIPSLLPQGAQGVFPEIVRELGRIMEVKHRNIGLGDCCHMEAGIDISPSREEFFTLSKYFLIVRLSIFLFPATPPVIQSLFLADELLR
jgi:hypothetical protein